MSRPSPTVILVRTQEEGNIGSAARAMANMGLESLILVDPRARIGDTARAFAVGAGHVLDGVVVTASLGEALAPFGRVVGSTSARGRNQVGITARELPTALAADAAGTATALVFGPEASGLTAEELALCAPIVCVPCAPRQPTLNLAQAVLVVAYELYQAALPTAPTHEPERAARGEVAGLMADVTDVLERVGFARDSSFDGVLRDLTSLASRSGLTPREVTILRGICRRARHGLRPAGRGPGPEGR
ncbi:MAG: TrmJ/YjtD family RNA methyltransferase [Thermoanaerobaculia bacterium]